MRDNLRLNMPTKWWVNPVVAPVLKQQVDGDHYTKMKIQPVEYIHANNIGFLEGNVIKYVSRWKDKGGVADLKKAIHCIELLVDLEKASV